MATLILRDGLFCLRTDHAVDLSAIVSFLRQLLLGCGHDRVVRLVAVTVGIGVAIIVTRVFIIRVGVAVSVVIVWITPIRPPRIESGVEDHPGAVNVTAAVTVPPVIAIAGPIPMPIGRTLGKHVVLPVRRQTAIVPELSGTVHRI